MHKPTVCRRLRCESLERRELLAGVPAFDEAVVLQAGDGDLKVDAYSVPETADFNADGLPDLLIGEKTLAGEGKVRVYLNTGTAAEPVYGDWSYARAEEADVAVPGSGCLGVFPQVTDFDRDGNNDLLLGLADGRVQIWVNERDNAAPLFRADGYLVTGPPGPPGPSIPVDVGIRATVDVVDFDGNGRWDLVLGGYDGKVRLLLDWAAEGAPQFRPVMYLQDAAGDLVVPGVRSSPVVYDFDLDGDHDLVCGNTAGQLLFYANQGTNAEPVFAEPKPLRARGVPIDLPDDPRSRPSVGDYNGDGVADLLVGAADGLVRFYAGRPIGPTVVDRHVFYNNSAHDGSDARANEDDDAAIATDKRALLPGEAASFENYTSYGRGINGVMIDVDGLAAADPVYDLTLKIGNDNEPAGWPDAPEPTSVTVRRGAGTDGSDRITAVWGDRTVVNRWLEVTLLIDGQPADVCYFGNAVGEGGNSPNDAMVTATDLLLARNNPRTFLNPAGIDFAYDYNRDQRVSATDLLLARNNVSSFLTALKLIDLSGL